MDVLTKLTALTVTVEWYLLSLPPLIWMYGQAGLIAGMAICQCMAVSTYMTCVLKDMLSCPRPYMFRRDADPSAGAATADGTATAADSASAHGNQPPLDNAVAATVSTEDTAAAATAPRSLPPAAGVVAELTTVSAPTQIGKQHGQPLLTTGADAAASDPNEGKPGPKAGAGLAAAAAAEPEGEASREVALLEEAYRNEVEYGAPSMHTWCALIMPAYAATAAAQLGAVGTGRAAALTAGAGCWAMWVGLTRLYLGVHTPVDLLLGALGGSAVLGLWRRLGLAQVIAAGAALPSEAAAATAAAGGAAVWWPEEEEGGGGGGAWASWFGFRVERRLAALAAVGVLYVTALATYPMPETHTTSYEYAVIFLGAAYGGLLGCHPSCSLLSPLLQRETLVRMPGVGNAAVLGAVGDGSWDQLGGDGTAAAAAATLAQHLSAAAPRALRHPVAVLMLGFAFVAAVKLISKALLSELLPKLLDLVPLRLRLLWQPPVHPSGCCAGGSPPPPQQQRSEKRKPLSTPPSSSSSSAAVEAVASSRKGVLMKTPTLPYDVDFLRKFLNYGLTVFAVVDFRHVAAALLMPGGRGGVQQ